MNTPTPATDCAAHPHARPHVAITYCTQCNWMLRSAWLAQELLSTFGQELAAVSLHPSSGGIFEIRANDTLIWERKRDGGFPEAKVLKQRLRDLIWPERDLGHADRKPTDATKPTSTTDTAGTIGAIGATGASGASSATGSTTSTDN